MPESARALFSLITIPEIQNGWRIDECTNLNQLRNLSFLDGHRIHGGALLVWEMAVAAPNACRCLTKRPRRCRTTSVKLRGRLTCKGTAQPPQVATQLKPFPSLWPHHADITRCGGANVSGTDACRVPLASRFVYCKLRDLASIGWTVLEIGASMGS
jgi:hypothetical protein